MTCTAEQRTRAKALARQLAADPAVLGADAVEPHVGLHDRWTIELTLTAATTGLTPALCRALAAADARVPADGAGRQGEHQRFVVVLPSD